MMLLLVFIITEFSFLELNSDGKVLNDVFVSMVTAHADASWHFFF